MIYSSTTRVLNRLAGANPSAEDNEDGALEEGAETVNNVVYSFRLQQTSFDKKSYLTYLKVRHAHDTNRLLSLHSCCCA